MTGGAGGANQAWATKRQKKEGPNPKRFKNNSRPGHHDGTARLADMDLDGVAAEVVYSELSFFRYLDDLKESQHDTTVAFNDALATSRRPTRAPRRLVPDPDPRDRRRGERGRARRRARREVAPASRCSRPSSASRLLPRALRPAVGAHPGDRPPDLLPHRPQHRARRPRQRDPTPQRDHGADGDAQHRRGARHVGDGRRARALPRAQGRVRRARPRLDRVVAVHHRRHGHAPELRAPDLTELPSFYFHRNVFLTFIEEPEAWCDLLRHRLGVENIMWSTDYPHPVSSWPNSRKIAAESVAACPERTRARPRATQRVWNL